MNGGLQAAPIVHSLGLNFKVTSYKIIFHEKVNAYD